MRYLVFFIIIAVSSIVTNAQAQKYIDLTYVDFSSFTPTFTGVGTGTVLDEQQKDAVKQRDSNLQPYGIISLHFKNVSGKKNKICDFSG